MKHKVTVSAQINSLRSQIKVLAIRMRDLRRVQSEFNREPQVETHRSHGRLTPDEKSKIRYYSLAGIPDNQIAARFACSQMTVYIYSRYGI